MKIVTTVLLSLLLFFTNNITFAQTQNGITEGSFSRPNQPELIAVVASIDTLWTTGEIDSVFAGGDTISFTFEVTAALQDTARMKVKYGEWNQPQVPMMFILNGDSIGTVIATNGYISPGPEFVEWDVTQSILSGTNNVSMISADTATGDAVLGHIDIIAIPDTISPQLSFSADTLDFATVFIGYLDSLELIITNLGRDTLIISNISSDNADFTFDVTSSTLAKNEFDTLLVKFSSSNSGLITGALTFTSNDFQNSAKTVLLMANSAEAPIISVSPSSITQVLVTGDSVFYTLRIDNLGTGDSLKYDISSFASASAFFQTTSPIDKSSGEESAAKSNSTALAPDLAILDFAYMAEQTTNSVLVLNTTTNLIAASVSVGSFPHRLEFSPGGDEVWVANKSGGTTSVIRTFDNTVVASISVGSSPFGIAFSPDGGLAYQAVKNDNKVVVIDVATRTIINTITGFDQPKDIAITPDGNFAYVVSHYGTVYVIDLFDDTIAQTISGVTGGHTIRISRDGLFAYISEASNDYPNSFRVIDLTTNTVTATIGSFDGSEGFDITPDGRFAYIMDRWANQLQKIDLITNTVVKIFTDGNLYDGYGVAISTDGKYGYATVPWISGNYGIHIFDTETDVFISRIETDKRIREIITFDPTSIPWLVTTPESGAIAAGSGMDVELKIDALGLRPGNYGAIIEFNSNDPAQPKSNITIKFKVLPPPIDPPVITSIKDVPADQGGWVEVSWDASPDDDFFSSTPIISYSVWVRDNSPAGAAFNENEVLIKSANQNTENSGIISSNNGSLLPAKLSKSLSDHDRWIGVGSVSASQDSSYTFLVHTLADSNSSGDNLSIIRVTAHPDNPFTFASSEPDSGYSVDNLKPSAPIVISVAMIFEGLLFELGPIEDIDFDLYAIYKSDESGFDPSLLDSFSTTTDSFYVDSDIIEGATYFYRLSSFDKNGNESDYTDEFSSNVVSVEGERVGIPSEYALAQNYPNPFNPITNINYSLPIGGKISLVIYDLNGKEVMRWDEEATQAGYFQKKWNGTNMAGNRVSSGVYLYRLISGEFVQTRKMLLLK